MKMIEGTTKAMTTEGMMPLLFPSQEDSITLTYTHESGATYVRYADDLLDAADLIRLDQEASEEFSGTDKLVSVTITF